MRRGKVQELSFTLPALHKRFQTQDIFTTQQTFAEFVRKLYFAVIDGLKFAAYCVVIFALPTVLIITIVTASGKVQFTGKGVVWFTSVYGSLLGVTNPIPALCALTYGVTEDTQQPELDDETPRSPR
jgi:hypothetical protein